MFRKILIANRGEIACRVVKTARRLGIGTVAVFSEADADARHTRVADEAVLVGPPPARESYLDIGRIVDAARKTGAQAIHPGYGFLSENADFADAVQAAGIAFIGPSGASMRKMGSKAGAKDLMAAAGVPVVPGYTGEDQSPQTLQREADRIGYPLMIKAAHGGGGKGMRIVRAAGEFAANLESCQREAKNAFGKDRVLLERYIEHPRHIEIQIFGDARGNAIYLGERECSAQRRYQKVLEESPSPFLTPELRAAMGAAAVQAAHAIDYANAGTVEFIVGQDGGFYFMEINTRLQVEHPVTEEVTGLDLVEWQLRIAAGEPLPLAQHEVRMRGHAIEARLYVEDPYARPTPFAPQTGRIAWWRPESAAAQPGVRIDHGIAEGGEVSPYYDAMVAKVIAHGRDRDDAIRRLRAALQDAPLLGLRHNARFLSDLLEHQDFRGATMTTSLIDEWFAREAPIAQRPQAGPEAWCVAAALLTIGTGTGEGWRADSVAAYDIELQCEGVTQRLRVHPGRCGTVQVALAEATHDVAVLAHADGRLRYRFDGVQRHAVARRDGGGLMLALGADTFAFAEPSPLAAADAGVDARRLRAPVAGVVSQVAVLVGDALAAGQPVACVEAMKMEMWLVAPAAATVTALHVQPGEQVAAGALLAELEPSGEATA